MKTVKDNKSNNKNNYCTIIAFANDEYISEDWNWFFNDILKSCKKKGVNVVYAGPESSKIVLGKKTDSQITINIDKYKKQYGKGYLFVKNREFYYQEYEQSNIVLREASKYFNLPLN